MSALLTPDVLVSLAVLLSMVAYAVLGARRDAEAERRRSHFLAGAGDFFVHWFLWLVSPVEHAAIALGLGPDIFNFGGLAFGAVTGVLFGLGHFHWGAWSILAGGVCDIMDGRVARRLGRTSTYGTFIDSSLDRFVEVFLFLGLVGYYRDRPAGAFAAAAAMAGSLLVSYARARGESVGLLCKEGLMQRTERLALMCLAGLLDGSFARIAGRAPGTLLLWVTAAIAVATFGTAVYRTWWIAVRLRGKSE